MDQQASTSKRTRMTLWLKRLGLVGFLFFLIKGLVWVGVFVFVGKSCTGS